MCVVRVQYEKLYAHFKKSHTQEKRLIKKVRELNDEIMNNAKKVQTALKLSEEDQAQITRLKEEVNRAWKMVDASKEKELRAKETIQDLRKEIDNLTGASALTPTLTPALSSVPPLLSCPALRAASRRLRTGTGAHGAPGVCRLLACQPQMRRDAGRFSVSQSPRVPRLDATHRPTSVPDASSYPPSPGGQLWWTKVRACRWTTRTRSMR